MQCFLALRKFRSHVSSVFGLHQLLIETLSSLAAECFTMLTCYLLPAAFLMWGNWHIFRLSELLPLKNSCLSPLKGKTMSWVLLSASEGNIVIVLSAPVWTSKLYSKWLILWIEVICNLNSLLYPCHEFSAYSWWYKKKKAFKRIINYSEHLEFSFLRDLKQGEAVLCGSTPLFIKCRRETTRGPFFNL